MLHLQRPIDELHSILRAEPKIGQKEINRLPLQYINGAGNVRRHIDVIPVFQQTAQAVTGMLLVVNNEDGGLDRGHRTKGCKVSELFSANQLISQWRKRRSV